MFSPHNKFLRGEMICCPHLMLILLKNDIDITNLNIELNDTSELSVEKNYDPT